MAIKTTQTRKGVQIKNVAQATTIGIDIRDAREEGAGKARYALELTRALLSVAPNDLQFFLFTNKPNPLFPSSERVHQVHISGRGPLWHLQLRRYLLRQPVDFFLAPTSYIYPAIAPKTQKLAIVVHDLIAFLHSKTHAHFPTLVERFTIRKAIKNSRFLICVSRHTAKDLATLYPEAHKKSVVIASPAVSKEVHRVMSEKLDLPAHFLLGVGTLNPRKNFQALFEAFEQLAEQHKNLHIVIAGGTGWRTSTIFKSVPADLKHRIHFLGHVTAAQLNELYSRAEMLVFPSLYEGFGIPPLEAMACACPVVCSNATSLPEVVGDAALLVDLHSKNTLTEAITEMLTPTVRELYIKKGLKHVLEFSWEESARRILAQL